MQPDSSPAAGETIGQRLKRLRVERGLSQRELAGPGVSYAYISRIEAGSRQPSVKALRRLAAKLTVSADYLETGSDLDPEATRELRLGELELAVRLGEHEGADDGLAATLQDALAAGDRAAALRARAALAQLALESGRDDRTVALLEEALEDEPFLPEERFDLYASLGRAYAGTGAPERAAELFERCLAGIVEAGGDGALETRYAMLLGYALSDAGDLVRAEQVVQAAFARAGDSPDPYMRVRLCWSRARLAHATGREAVALAHVRKAIALLQATEDTLYLARAHVLAASITIERGDALAAGAHVEAAERLLGSGGSPEDVFELERHRSGIALLEGRATAAAAHARNALDLAAKPADEGHARLALAESLAALEDGDGASASYARAVELLEGSGQGRSAAAAYRAWGGFLERHGRDGAADALARAAALGLRPPSRPAPAER